METLRTWWDNDSFRFYTLLLACLILTRLPIIGRYFRLLATMVHEGGHVLAALLLRDNPKKVSLFQDTSGVTLVESSARWKTVIVAISGYPLPAFAAYLSLWMLQQHHITAYMTGVAVITALFLLFYIRNFIGILWALAFIALHIFLLYKQATNWIGILAQTDAFVLFIESLASTLTLLRIAWQSPKQAGDASTISRIIKLPSIVIALFFLSLNLFIAYKCAVDFFPAAQ